MCLLFSQISISTDRNVPAFSEAGTPFYPPILKKRRKNVRCIVERFLKTARNSRTKPEKVSVCYMKGKISIDPCFFLPKCPLYSGGQSIADALVLKFFLRDPLIHRENVRCKVKRNFCSTPPNRGKSVRCKVRGFQNSSHGTCHFCFSCPMDCEKRRCWDKTGV